MSRLAIMRHEELMLVVYCWWVFRTGCGVYGIETNCWSNDLGLAAFNLKPYKLNVFCDL